MPPLNPHPRSLLAVPLVAALAPLAGPARAQTPGPLRADTLASIDALFSFEAGTDDYRFTGERAFRLRRFSPTLPYTFGRPGPPRRQPPPQQGGGVESVGF